MNNTYLEKLNYNIDKIQDSKIKDIYIEFITFRLEEKDKPSMIYHYQKAYFLFAKALKNIYIHEFTWECMCKIVIKDKKNVKVLSYFLIYLIKRNLYTGEDKEYITELIEYIGIEKITIGSLVKLFDINKRPMHFYVIKYTKNIKGKNFLSDILVNLNTSNINLRKIMIEFINSSLSTCRTYHKFFSHFELSLGKTKINTVKDFNIDTFDCQFKYYLKIESGKFLNILSLFYLFLCLNYSSENIFSDRDTVDMEVLRRTDFVKSYKLGFRKILYNPNDSIPISNKWFLAPNGFERTSTRVNANDYLKIDFDIIKDKEMKEYSKMWFWFNKSLSIKTKISVINNSIKIFSNFIYNFRNNTTIKVFSSVKVIAENTISQFEVNAFKNYIQSIYTNVATIAFILVYVRSFIEFLHENNLVKIEYGVLYILKYKKARTKYKDKNIPIEDLKAFEKKLKEKAKESFINNLYYALFHLAISCELRISQLINLRIDSVQESMKTGEYIIRSITKTSKGENIEQPISTRTKNHIDNIMKITKSVRNECSDSYISNFLFIKKGTANVYGVIKLSSFLQHLKKCCKLAEIPIYTPNNLRATYITRAKEMADENNWSKFDFLKITNHKSFDVVDKHYVGNQIRNLLEATYGIIIGNTPVKGQIVNSSIVKQTPKNTVDDGCGMCTIKVCTVQTELGCPMCSNFIATINNIPYFEEKILKIDKKILNINIVHEVELLRAIKKIYIAYLERLYILKEGINIE